MQITNLQIRIQTLYLQQLLHTKYEFQCCNTVLPCSAIFLSISISWMAIGPPFSKGYCDLLQWAKGSGLGQ